MPEKLASAKCMCILNVEEAEEPEEQSEKESDQPSLEHDFVTVTLKPLAHATEESLGGGAHIKIPSPTSCNMEDVNARPCLCRYRAIGFLDIAASRYHSAAITSDGLVYTWGSSRVGALGLGGRRSE